MSEPTIYLALGRTAGMLRRNDRERRVVGTCSTCDGKRYVFGFDEPTGFCQDCIARSRVLEDDDIGGES